MKYLWILLWIEVTYKTVKGLYYHCSGDLSEWSAFVMPSSYFIQRKKKKFKKKLDKYKFSPAKSRSYFNEPNGILISICCCVLYKLWYRTTRYLLAYHFNIDFIIVSTIFYTPTPGLSS